jgi:mannose-6-phosphate isomerase-like protein (cupin superfamily)
MKFSVEDIGGKVVKQDDRYVVKDNTELSNLIVSSTELYPGKSTSGHSHAGQEEVYMFMAGQGEMELDNERFSITKGDVVLIEDGVFHRVHNTSTENLYFICVFDGRRNH